MLVVSRICLVGCIPNGNLHALLLLGPDVDLEPPPHSDVATKSVLERPWPEGSTIRVLCVIQPPLPVSIANGGVGLHNYQALTDSLLKAAKELVDLTAVKLEILGVSIETCVREGDPRAEIVDEAKDWRADLIVVGSHGRTGIARWLLGSVAAQVVRHASCSVEVVRRQHATGANSPPAEPTPIDEAEEIARSIRE
jgi:nucleotide-binding universal stress UspA family protein